MIEFGVRPIHVERQLILARGCTILTTNMLKGQAALMVKRFGWQPYRLSKTALTYNYISWAMPKRKSWTGTLTKLMLYLSAAGISDLMVLKELPPRYARPR